MQTVSILFCNHPGVFDHPRHPFSDPNKAAEVFRPVLRSFRCWVISPKVGFSFGRSLEGGVTEIDLRAIKEAFLWGGARDVIYEDA